MSPPMTPPLLNHVQQSNQYNRRDMYGRIVCMWSRWYQHLRQNVSRDKCPECQQSVFWAFVAGHIVLQTFVSLSAPSSLIELQQLSASHRALQTANSRGWTVHLCLPPTPKFQNLMHWGYPKCAWENSWSYRENNWRKSDKIHLPIFY